MLTSDILELGRLAVKSEAVKQNHIRHAVDVKLATAINSQLELIVDLHKLGIDYHELSTECHAAYGYLRAYWDVGE